MARTNRICPETHFFYKRILQFGWVVVFCMMTSGTAPQAALQDHEGTQTFLKRGSDTLLVVWVPPSAFTRPVESPDDDRRSVIALAGHADIFLLSGSAQLEIQSVHTVTCSDEWESSRLQWAEDVPIGDGGESASLPAAVPDEKVWSLEKIHSLETRTAFYLRFFSWEKTSSGKWAGLRRIEMTLIGDGIQPVSFALLDSLSLTQKMDRKKDTRRLSPSMPAEVRGTPSYPRLKVWMREEGLAFIPRSLVTGAGWPEASLDPRTLHLFGPEGEIPILLGGEADGKWDPDEELIFAADRHWNVSPEGDKRLDAYATSNVYWLEKTENYGRRMGGEDGSYQERMQADIMFPRSFPYTQHEEKDTYFSRLPDVWDVEPEDHWLYDSYLMGGMKKQVVFQVIDPDLYATQLAAIRIRCRGQSYSGNTQAVEAYLNDHKLAEATWSGNQGLTLVNDGFSPSYFKEGENTLTLINASGESAAQVMLDWFECTYPRLYRADGGTLTFLPPAYSAGKSCRFRIEGFSGQDIEIYKKGVSRITGIQVEPVTDENGKSYTAVFQDNIFSEETEYIAVTASARILPDSVLLVTSNPLEGMTEGAEYLIITPHDSLGQLDDLLSLREHDGLVVKRVKLDDIYDAYNHGIPSPRALKDFFTVMHSRLSPALRFVLLIGDGALDGRPGSPGNLIPVPLEQTEKLGAAPSDHWYAMLEGQDDAPDVAIGRLPVRSAAELAAVIEKIVYYETQSTGPWRNEYLMIGAGGSGDVFRVQTETLIGSVLPARLHPERLYLSGPLTDPFVGGTEDLLRHFRNGKAWINFRGHGGGAIWSDGGLLDLDDVPLIDNRGKLPFVTSMTCYSNDFASSRDCLGEALVRQERTGAVAVWGATGLGWVWNDYYLLEEFCEVLKTRPALTLGEMIQEAKRLFLSVHGGNIASSEVYQYTLLGDPAMKVALPGPDLHMELQNRSMTQADTAQVSGTAQEGSYQIVFDLSDNRNVPVSTITSSFSAVSWEASIPIPPALTGKGGIRAYMWNEDQPSVHGSSHVPFAIDQAYFDSLAVLPAEPTSRDTLRFSAWIESRAEIRHAWCVLLQPSPTYLEMKKTDPAGHYITNSAAGPFAPNTLIAYFFLIENSEGVKNASDTTSLTVPSLSDLTVESLEWEGSERVTLKAGVRNSGGENVRSAVILFEAPDLHYTRTESFAIEGYSRKEISIPFITTPGQILLRVTADADSSLHESAEDNNRFEIRLTADHFNVSPGLGSISGLDRPDTVGLTGTAWCRIPPGAVSSETALLLKMLQQDDPLLSQVTAKPDMETVLLAALKAPGLSSALTREATFFLNRNHADSTDAQKPYRWDEEIDRWVVCPYSVNDTAYVFGTERLGFFCLSTTRDCTPPRIEIELENQPFVSGAFVPHDAVFTILVQDSSGVDLDPAHTEIFLDHMRQEGWVLTFPDSVRTAGEVVINLRPALSTGEHTISVRSRDIEGNIGFSDEIPFRVESSLAIQFLGNHPNPFSRETIFIYTLTDMAEEAEIKIYTVSGKCIRTLETGDMAMADYHEVPWDGTDEWGNQVANGVYFFRLRVEGGGAEHEITGKIARIQ